MHKKKRRVVAYCRVSTLEQKKNGYGIDIQIRDTTLCAQHNNLLVEKFYKDEGESGVKENRAGLKKLIRDCETGRVGTVIITNVLRLAREMRIAENLFYKFKKLNIKILIADMPQYNEASKEDVLFRQIKQAFGELERRDIIKRLFRGRQERVRQGKFAGGNLPYGYTRSNKMIEIDSYESRIIIRIFTLSAEGMTAGEVAEKLNLDGYTRRNTKPWTGRMVSQILRKEPLYKDGVITYGNVKGECDDPILQTKKSV